MAMKYKYPILVCLLVLLPACLLRAETLFDENFDDTPPYGDNGPLPTEAGLLRYGQWQIQEESRDAASTTTEVSLSSPRSLALAYGDNGRTSVSTLLGFDSDGARETTRALRVRVAVNLLPNSSAEVLLYGRDGFLGYAQAVMNENETGYIRAWFDHTADANRISIMRNTWYYIEMDFPDNPNSDSEYQVKVFESDGTTQIGETVSGHFYIRPSGNTAYRNLNLHSERAGGTVFFDNISVETVNSSDSSQPQK